MILTLPRLRPRVVAAAGLVVAIGVSGAAVLLAPTASAAIKTTKVTTTKTYDCFTLPVGGQVSAVFKLSTTKTYTVPDSVNVGDSFVIEVSGFTATADAPGSNIIRSSMAERGKPAPYPEDITRVNGASASYRIGTRYEGESTSPVSRPATISIPGQNITGPGPVAITGAGATQNIAPDRAGTLNVFEPASFTLRLNRFAANGSPFVAASLQCDSKGLVPFGAITVNPAGTPTTTVTPTTTAGTPTTTSGTPTTTSGTPTTTAGTPTTTSGTPTTTSGTPTTTSGTPTTTPGPLGSSSPGPNQLIGSPPGGPGGAGPGQSPGGGGIPVQSVSGGARGAGALGGSLARTGAGPVTMLLWSGLLLIALGTLVLLAARHRRAQG